MAEDSNGDDLDIPIQYRSLTRSIITDITKLYKLASDTTSNHHVQNCLIAITCQSYILIKDHTDLQAEFEKCKRTIKHREESYVINTPWLKHNVKPKKN